MKRKKQYKWNSFLYKGIAFSLIFSTCITGALANNPLTKENTTEQERSPMQKSNTVSGQVKDNEGNELIGVSVSIEGTTTGVITDVNGKYSINTPNANATLVFSYIGYITQKIKVGNNSAMNVTLVEDSKVLDEVVVTALGIKKDAKKLGYSVSNITADDITKSGSTNLATSLYGKAAGVRIQAAPGGSTSAVSVNIRGINSISGTNQPLIIVDGVPIRNGDANKDGFWEDQRINGNGLVDINPEDIESISILKGVAASSLYGSEAANGVMMITTKSGKGRKGLGIDFNSTFTVDKVAYLPKYQKTYGPGGHHDARSSDSDWAINDGWRKETINGKEYVRPQYETTQSFGPKFDGREVIYWDGSVRPYSPSSTGWEDIFRTGIAQTYNLAISSSSDKNNMRFSYTMEDRKNTQRNSDVARHNFSFTGSTSLHKNFKVDYTANYMRRNVQNRPYRMNRITNNFGGFLSNFDDVNLMWDKTITSQGYRVNNYDDSETNTPNENLLFGLGGSQLMSEYFWSVRKKLQDETNNRLIASITPTYTIMNGLSVRAKVGTDFSSDKIENKEATEKLLAFEPTGSYSITDKRYEIYYGDILLMYDKKVNDNWGITANLGYQARNEKLHMSKGSTQGGLSVENWFNLNASAEKAKPEMQKSDFLREALLGTLGISFNDYIFADATIRREKVSTLHPDESSYVYPSLSSSLLISEAFKNSLPAWINYGKVRASWGIVGNSPEIYKAYYAFNQASLNTYNYNTIHSVPGKNKDVLGFPGLKSEKKQEIEFGVEAKLFNNRLGLEATYYKNVTDRQILDVSNPWSSGAEKIIQNVGELQNSGWEFMLYGTPFQTKDWKIDLRGNISFNKNKVNKLIDGLDMLVHDTYDGAVQLVSRKGESMGDFITYLPKTDAKGNKIVGSNGLYEMDRSKRQVVGNTLPKATGGFGTTINYKNFALDMTIDFRIGGDVLNLPYQYLMGRGSLEEAMQYRDAENGGLEYFYRQTGTDDKGNPTYTKTLTNGQSSPNGERVWDDGIVLPGVKADGTPNDIVTTAGRYYNETFNWGASGNIDYSRSIFKNTYVKMREIALSYSLPQNLTSKFNCSNLTVSAFGRNLFYFKKNMPLFDAEATDGTTWNSQASLGGSSATSRTFGISLRASF